MQGNYPGGPARGVMPQWCASGGKRQVSVEAPMMLVSPDSEISTQPRRGNSNTHIASPSELIDLRPGTTTELRHHVQTFCRRRTGLVQCHAASSQWNSEPAQMDWYQNSNLPEFSSTYPQCARLFSTILQQPHAQCRTPCAILFEFASRIGCTVFPPHHPGPSCVWMLILLCVYNPVASSRLLDLLTRIPARRSGCLL